VILVEAGAARKRGAKAQICNPNFELLVDKNVSDLYISVDKVVRVDCLNSLHQL